MKLHNSIISWMVHLLVKGGKEAPSDAWDHEFVLLSHEVYNHTNIKDLNPTHTENSAHII